MDPLDRPYQAREKSTLVTSCIVFFGSSFKPLFVHCRYSKDPYKRTGKELRLQNSSIVEESKLSVNYTDVRIYFLTAGRALPLFAASCRSSSLYVNQTVRSNASATSDFNFAGKIASAMLSVLTKIRHLTDSNALRLECNRDKLMRNYSRTIQQGPIHLERHSLAHHWSKQVNVYGGFSQQ